jgi:hypothetical protein
MRYRTDSNTHLKLHPRSASHFLLKFIPRSYLKVSRNTQSGFKVFQTIHFTRFAGIKSGNKAGNGYMLTHMVTAGGKSVKEANHDSANKDNIEQICSM